MSRLADLTGDRYGRLLVIERAPNKGAKAAWRCICDCGKVKIALSTNLRRAKTRSCGCLNNEEGLRRRKGKPHYRTAHARISRARGKASAHPCVDCQGPAAEWSYDHTDPDELTGESAGRQVPYSVKPEHYAPRCKSCHTSFDMGRADAAEVMG